MSEKTFISSAEVAWEKAGEGVRRQVLGHGTDLMVVRVEFEANAIGLLHHHPHRQATYVAAGKFDVTVGKETRQLTTGDVFYAASDVVHGVKALEGGVLVDVFTPIRQDFISPTR